MYLLLRSLNISLFLDYLIIPSFLVGSFVISHVSVGHVPWMTWYFFPLCMFLTLKTVRQFSENQFQIDKNIYLKLVQLSISHGVMLYEGGQHIWIISGLAVVLFIFLYTWFDSKRLPIAIRLCFQYLFVSISIVSLKLLPMFILIPSYISPHNYYFNLNQLLKSIFDYRFSEWEWDYFVGYGSLIMLILIIPLSVYNKYKQGNYHFPVLFKFNLRMIDWFMLFFGSIFLCLVIVKTNLLNNFLDHFATAGLIAVLFHFICKTLHRLENFQRTSLILALIFFILSLWPYKDIFDYIPILKTQGVRTRFLCISIFFLLIFMGVFYSRWFEIEKCGKLRKAIILLLICLNIFSLRLNANNYLHLWNNGPAKLKVFPLRSSLNYSPVILANDKKNIGQVKVLGAGKFQIQLKDQTAKTRALYLYFPELPCSLYCKSFTSSSGNITCFDGSLCVSNIPADSECVMIEYNYYYEKIGIIIFLILLIINAIQFSILQKQNMKYLLKS